MRPETGAQLLLRRAGLIASDAPLEQASPADVTVAKELSEEMGGLPLALDQAGAYVEEVSYSLQDYQRLYQIRRDELLKERGGIAPDHPESVATTWSLAFQKVEQGNPVASDLLRLCAFLHPDAIPEEMITKGAEHLTPQLQATASDPLALNKAVMSLRAYSLLHRDSTSHTLTIHRLVQAVLKAEMDVGTFQQWAERTVGVVNAAFPYVIPEEWPFCEQLLPHALICIALIEKQHLVTPEVARLLNQTGYYLYERARYQEAESLLREALSIREQLLGPNHPDTALSLNDMALLYQAQKKYEQAESLFQRALAIREQQLGTQHPITAESLRTLALFYYEHGKYEQAELLYKRALAIREQQPEPENRGTASVLNDLALLYMDQGRFGEAEPLFQRALAIREQQPEPQLPGTSLVLNNLALLYAYQGKYQQAETLLQRALAIEEQLFEADHPHIRLVRGNYASLLRAMGRDAEADLLETHGAQP